MIAVIIKFSGSFQNTVLLIDGVDDDVESIITMLQYPAIIGTDDVLQVHSVEDTFERECVYDEPGALKPPCSMASW